MGMAASQARLLTITARMHDVEYQAQSIQNAKIALATQNDQVYKEYMDALDSTTFTVKNSSGEAVIANFNNLCGINAANASKSTRYVLRDEHNRIIVPDDVAEGYENFNGRGDAYEFAMFMMEGQPNDFNSKKYQDAASSLIDESKSTKISDMKSGLLDKINELAKLLPDIDMENAETLEAKIIAAGQWLDENSNIDPAKIEKGKELLSKINTIYEQLEYLIYTQSADELYEKAGNDKEDYDNTDFWCYVNMFMQIESNGGTYIKISEFDGIYGIGNAATDDEWLQSMVQSGKITIDVSTLDNKGKISFKSTGVSSDSNLEYTTTSSIDKSRLAKAEAEYEHKTRDINQKDKKFDMDLNKLETERSALKAEYESVKKVTEDNIERTFGIFS